MHGGPLRVPSVFSTSTPSTRNLWAAHSYNVAFSDEIDHFEYCNAITSSFSCAASSFRDPTDTTNRCVGDGDQCDWDVVAESAAVEGRAAIRMPASLLRPAHLSTYDVRLVRYQWLLRPCSKRRELVPILQSGFLPVVHVHRRPLLLLPQDLQRPCVRCSNACLDRPARTMSHAAANAETVGRAWASVMCMRTPLPCARTAQPRTRRDDQRRRTHASRASRSLPARVVGHGTVPALTVDSESELVDDLDCLGSVSRAEAVRPRLASTQCRSISAAQPGRARARSYSPQVSQTALTPCSPGASAPPAFRSLPESRSSLTPHGQRLEPLRYSMEPIGGWRCEQPPLQPLTHRARRGQPRHRNMDAVAATHTDKVIANGHPIPVDARAEQLRIRPLTANQR